MPRPPEPVTVLLQQLARMLPPVGQEPKRRLVPAKVFSDLY
jgi:hypothetical protein